MSYFTILFRAPSVWSIQTTAQLEADKLNLISRVVKSE